MRIRGMIEGRLGDPNEPLEWSSILRDQVTLGENAGDITAQILLRGFQVRQAGTSDRSFGRLQIHLDTFRSASAPTLAFIEAQLQMRDAEPGALVDPSGNTTLKPSDKVNIVIDYTLLLYSP